MFAILIGCTAPIDIKTDDSPPVIVIYGAVTNEFTHHKIMISRSAPYFDNKPNEGISGAKVAVQSSNNETYTFREHDTIPGMYLSNRKFSAQSGVDYSLSVEVDFDNDGIMDKYEAATTILPPTSVDSLTIEPTTMFGRKNYLLYLHFQDPPEKNHYLVNVIYNDSLLNAKLSRYIISDDKIFDGQAGKMMIFRFYEEQEQETDTEGIREYSVSLYPGDTVITETCTITKEYFDFIDQCQKEQGGEVPIFGGPAANIATNISNGGLGFFTGYCIFRNMVIHKQEN
jgi:hypothetical protein